MMETPQKTENTEKTESKETILPDNSALFKALAKAQGEFKEIKKNCSVDFPSKKGGRVKFKYADLACIRDATTPALSKNGLATVQIYESRKIADGRYQTMLVTLLMHGSAVIRSELPIDTNIEVKELGSLTTYYRRYQLAAILGIAADEDTDVQGVPQGRQQGHQNRKPPQSKPQNNPKSEDQAPSRDQLGLEIMEAARNKGATPKELSELVMEMFKTQDMKGLTMPQMEELLKELS